MNALFYLLLGAGLLGLMALVLWVASLFDEPLCQYCNNDGDPCPRCHGYTSRKENR